MYRIKVKPHPYIPDVLVRSDGMVYIPSKRGHPGHWTPGTKDPKGYYSVRINYQNYSVHRLVAETFIVNNESKPLVDHIDRNPSNNDVWNLRWVTYAENLYNKNNNLELGRRVKDYKSKDDYLKEYSKLYQRERRKDPVLRKCQLEATRKCRARKKLNFMPTTPSTRNSSI